MQSNTLHIVSIFEANLFTECPLIGAAVGVSVTSKVDGEVGGEVGEVTVFDRTNVDRTKLVGAFDGASRLGAKEAKLARAVGRAASAAGPNRGADEKADGEKVGFEDTDNV